MNRRDLIKSLATGAAWIMPGKEIALPEESSIVLPNQDPVVIDSVKNRIYLDAKEIRSVDVVPITTRKTSSKKEGLTEVTTGVVTEFEAVIRVRVKPPLFRSVGVPLEMKLTPVEPEHKTPRKLEGTFPLNELRDGKVSAFIEYGKPPCDES